MSYNRFIVLGKQLGQGGEGYVAEVQGNASVVAKIYHKIPDKERSDKIMAMIDLKNERLLKLAAWPMDFVKNTSNELIGFTMEKLCNYHPLFELYGPKLRLKKFPQADWRFLIHAAANTARAFDVMHEAGHVIGDVNHGNLLVGNDATVKFIDTDSFQISTNRKTWLCEVGVSTHQPPEMQGRATYKGIIRTKNHDNFGLAVLIFQLLCLARHPFSGRFSGTGEMPIEKAIAEYRFAYSKDRRMTKMAPPPASLQMEALTPRIVSFFDRAFSSLGIRSARPTAKEWVAALEESLLLLKTCRINKAHYYLSSLGGCPWCEIEAVSGSTLFPIILSSSYDSQNIASLWGEMLNLKEPEVMPPLPNVNTILVAPSVEARACREKILKYWKLSLIFIGIASVLSSIIFNYQVTVFLLFGSFFSLAFYGLCKFGKLRSKIEDEWETAQEKWVELVSNWNVGTGISQFNQIRQYLKDLKHTYDKLGKEQHEQLQELIANKRHQQLMVHLGRFPIEKAGLEGIGTGRIAVLQRYGIKTAADIELHRFSGLSGFGSKLIQKLMNWRVHCESTFVFSSYQHIGQSDMAMIERTFGLKKRKLEHEFSIGLAKMKQVRDQVNIWRERLQGLSSSLVDMYAQARANARAVWIHV